MKVSFEFPDHTVERDSKVRVNLSQEGLDAIVTLAGGLAIPETKPRSS